MKSICYIVAIFMFFIGCTNVSFQELQKGNCVDRVIELKKRLDRRGYHTKVILGLVRKDGEITKAHAWIKYRKNETRKWKEIKNY